MKYAIGTAAYVVVLIAVTSVYYTRTKRAVIQHHGEAMWKAWR